MNLMEVRDETLCNIAIAMNDPLDFANRQDFEIRSKFKIGTVYVASGEAITAQIDAAFSGGGGASSGSLDMGDVMDSVGEQYGVKKEDCKNSIQQK